MPLPVPDWNAVLVNPPQQTDADAERRLRVFNEANSRAQKMVKNMATIINSDNPEHQQIVKDAFGANPNVEAIKATIKKLDTEPVKIDSTDIAPGPAGAAAWVHPQSNVRLGAPFFESKWAVDQRAGTLIHEGTHQLSDTGDRVNMDNKMIAGPSNDASRKVPPKTDEKGRVTSGYNYEKPMMHPLSEPELSPAYRKLRDDGVDLHRNADSYRVFAHLCSSPGVLPRDVELFRRALLEADDDDHVYLARRNSCRLPPKYFENRKKAKAVAASTKSTTSKAETPARKAVTKNSSLNSATRKATSGQKIDSSSKSGSRLSVSKQPTTKDSSSKRKSVKTASRQVTTGSRSAISKSRSSKKTSSAKPPARLAAGRSVKKPSGKTTAVKKSSRLSTAGLRSTKVTSSKKSSRLSSAKQPPSKAVSKRQSSRSARGSNSKATLAKTSSSRAPKSRSSKASTKKGTPVKSRSAKVAPTKKVSPPKSSKSTLRSSKTSKKTAPVKSKPNLKRSPKAGKSKVVAASARTRVPKQPALRVANARKPKSALRAAKRRG